MALATSSRKLLPGLAGSDFSLRGILDSFISFGIFIKFLYVQMLLGYFLSFTNFVDVLYITPGTLLPNFKIWALFTYSLIEAHFYSLLINFVVLFIVGKVISPLWGSLEVLLFYLITTVISGLWVTMFHLIAYMFVGNIDFIFAVKISGNFAFIAAVFVTLKQLMPEEVVSTLPFLHIRVKHLPFSLFAISALLTFVHLMNVYSLLLQLSGIMISWIYLRFYQLHANTRGDFSDGFTFASFFPEIAQPFVAFVSNGIYALLTRLGICKKIVKRYDVGASSGITLTVSPAERADYDRRRQLALKALSERLNKQDGTEACPSQTWPTLDNEESEINTSTDLQTVTVESSNHSKASQS